jgi:hypothetical protein
VPSAFEQEFITPDLGDTQMDMKMVLNGLIF